MALRLKILILIIASGVTILPLQAAEIDKVLMSYKQHGAGNFSAARGEALWKKQYPNKNTPGAMQNCTTCHGDDLRANGKHVRTGKTIEPMAPSVNAKRFTDQKFIEKWFRRNCKGVMGRECTPQEKGDLLTYLRRQ